jgi:hypothetical protein
MRNLVLIVCVAFSVSISAQIDGVGINTTDPKSTLDINGNLSLKVVSLNGGPSGTPTEIDDGTYINLEPTVGNAHFELPDPTLVPGRIYILRNISNTQTALILTKGVGVLFFSGDSSTGSVLVNMTTSTGSGNETKTLIFVSDGFNWTYGKLGF